MQSESSYIQSLLSKNVKKEERVSVVNRKVSVLEMAEVEYHRVSPAEGDFFRSILTPRDGEDLRPRISALARARGWPLKELTRDRHTLEDIFIHITRSEEEF